MSGGSNPSTTSKRVIHWRIGSPAWWGCNIHGRKRYPKASDT